ncbi:hypothetical protein [Clostridium thailandense]|uniref:hypothetical protein n=1 Tax=Clostridium thailandense TaxID=2794346 RepID=UPI0039898F2D
MLIYGNDKQIGEAKQVNFHDNAHMKRKGRPLGHQLASMAQLNDKDDYVEKSYMPKQTISFSNIMGGNE